MLVTHIQLCVHDTETPLLERCAGAGRWTVGKEQEDGAWRAGIKDNKRYVREG